MNKKVAIQTAAFALVTLIAFILQSLLFSMGSKEIQEEFVACMPGETCPRDVTELVVGGNQIEFEFIGDYETIQSESHYTLFAMDALRHVRAPDSIASWVSHNPEVALVREDGVVVPVSSGRVEVCAEVVSTGSMNLPKPSHLELLPDAIPARINNWAGTGAGTAVYRVKKQVCGSIYIKSLL